MAALHAPESAPTQAIAVRAPTVGDGTAVWRLVKDSGVLEPNSCYAYLLLCAHFSDTCRVAGRERDIVGFVAAYRPPVRPDSVFVWQIGVQEKARGEGLGKRLLHALVESPGCRMVRFLEATVAPSNIASQRLFKGFARDHGVPCELSAGFESEDFGPPTHEAEPLYRIGPLRKLR